MAFRFSNLTAILFSLTQSIAIAAEPITLEKAFKLAKERNETPRIAQAQVEQAEERVIQSRANLLPRLSVFGAIDTPLNQFTARLRLQYGLFNGFRDFKNYQMSKRNLDRIEQNSHQTDLGLKQQIVQFFYNALSSQEDAKLLQEQLINANKRILELKQRVKIGRTRESELLSMQQQASQIEASLALSQANKNQAMAQLENVIDLEPGNTLASVRPEEATKIRVEPLEFYLTHIVERPDLKMAQAEIEASEDRIGVARASHFPELTLTADYFLARNWMQLRDYNLNLGLTLPLFDGLGVQASVREAHSAVKERTIQLASLQRSARREVETAHLQLQGWIQQRSSLETAIGQADKAYQSLLKEYQLGLGTHLEVLQAFNTLLELRRSSVRVAYQIISQKQLLQLAAGFLGEEKLR